MDGYFVFEGNDSKEAFIKFFNGSPESVSIMLLFFKFNRVF